MTAYRLPFATALLLLAGLPLLATAVLALGALFDAAAWRALWQEPQWLRALGLTLWTGLASTALAWWVSAALLAQGFVRQSLGRLLRGLPVMLATPHAAFAIGLVFLLAPSGWLLRALSPWLTGFEFPPPWPTTQDPWGLGLIAALTAKEIPFLLWTAATQLQRDDLRQRWRSEHALAQTLGYSPQRAFWRVVWPQLGARLFWPLLAVLAYGLTVVDMALVIGPASPPTLAVLAWQWLQDADLAVNAQGAAAGGVLALTLLWAALLWLGIQHLHLRGGRRLNGRRGAASQATRADQPGALPASFLLLAGLYGAVLLALAVGSIAGVWPFPRAWPETVTWQAWHRVWDSRGTVVTTLGLALASAALALAWSVAWLELAPRRWDNALRPVLYLPLVLPAVLWVVGLYSLALQWRLEGQWLGLLLAHTFMVLPYVLLALSPAYLGFDARYAQLSASLGHGPWHFLWRIKWPLLRRSLAASAAVGFAVSVAQYLPTLYIGAGRFSSVTTEAVNLAAGGQRSLTGAYAGLQFVLPVLAFALAAWLGAPRRFKPAHT
ncbi:ABC transporter permease subunit [Rhodoferax sp.]|uniref:ABC transporter permease n=1 Tax=Rhodoferax sp. TaxID=50421 RepID=UPI0025E537FE|nr:ABC transporter permease subunit [Rhodoferax sp.]